MEEREQPENHDGNHWEFARSGTNRWLILAAVVLLVAAGLAFGYGYRQQLAVGHLTAQESVADATINQLQGQLSTVTAKLNDMAAAQQAAQQAATQAAAQKKTQASAVAKRGTTAAEKHYKQLQAQLEDQQKQLKDTQDLVAKNRSDLEGSLGSTRDELNGSIARTHDELVALEKRGERSYFEFDLAKSKQFQRVGPLSLSLRKADTKHKSYEIQMVVDDNHLTKKNVNLYEPVWIHAESESQPVQIVVNRIEKNLVHGYISAPKYKPSEIAATGAAAVTPVAAHPQQPDQNPQSPKQPEQ
ncbi:MAG TPA: hypothetical protein VE263_15170 [Candidatus Angelobacter sp.]|nr:hypothetical protein [Candidatus Angelobacter sp.]